MSLQGNLQDMNLADLIQQACQDGKQAHLRLQRTSDGQAADLFVEAGQVVHAECGAFIGEEAVYRLLTWTEGAFVLEPDIEAPQHSISASYAGLLLEGMRRIDDGETGASADAEAAVLAMFAGLGGPRSEGGPQEQRMAARASDLRKIEGVTGVVIAAPDGIVLDQALDGDAEKEGAVAVFVGYAASQAGESLGLGSFEWGTIKLGKDTMLVVGQAEAYIGLLLDEKASPAMVISKLVGIMK